MRRYFICFLAIGLILFISFPCYAQTGNRALVGTWKLIAMELVDSDGKVVEADEWLGKKPIGIIMYDSIGYMSVQLMRDPQEPGAFDKYFADRYYAYYGTYEIVAKVGTEGKEGNVIHHLQGSLIRGETGRSFQRTFKISGNRITLTAITPTGITNKKLTFERVEKGK
jgi:hypothetical protein